MRISRRHAAPNPTDAIVTNGNTADSEAVVQTYTPQLASHKRIRERAIEPQSFSSPLQGSLRTKKKPGANPQTASIAIAKAACRRANRSS